MTEMTMMPPQLQTIDQAMLTPLVRQVFRSDAVEVIDWHLDQIQFEIITPLTLGLYRIRGTATAQDKPDTAKPWSMVLKIVHPAEYLPEAVWKRPDSLAFLKRESLVYRSDLRATLPKCIAIPRLLNLTEQPNNTDWLWMEDISDCYPTGWPLERYALAGHHLGVFNGMYLTNLKLPDYPWLTGQFLRGWVTFMTGETRMKRVIGPATWEHPLVRCAYPVPIAERFLNLVAKSNLLVNMVGRLPQVLCHMDANCGNLFARQDVDGHDQTVLIDWALSGINGVGCELGQLVWGSIPNRVPNSDTDRLEAMVFEEYLVGLRAAGWKGKETIVRFGYLAQAFCCLGIFRMVESLELAFDEPKQAQLEAKQHRPITEILADEGATIYSLLDRGEEALRLLDTVSAMV